MKRLFSLSLWVAVISGCAGGGTSIGNATWGGRWSGNFEIPTVGQIGTMSISVATDGTIKGSGVNSTLNQSFNMTGSIKEDGTINWILSNGSSGTITGGVTKGSNGHMVGIVSLQNGINQPQNVNIDLIHQ